MKLHGLLVQPNLRLKASRISHRPKPKPTAPNRWCGIDMTKVPIAGFEWVYVVCVLNWYTKKIVGHYAGLQARSWHWLVAFMQACRAIGITTPAFTSYNNPKGNADTERLMRTVKEELVWIHEWKSPVAFMAFLEEWVKKYNNDYLHSALRYQTPMAFEQQHSAHRTQLQTT